MPEQRRPRLWIASSRFPWCRAESFPHFSVLQLAHHPSSWVAVPGSNRIAAGGPEFITVRDSFLLEASHREHIDVPSSAKGVADQCAFNGKAKPLVQLNGCLVIGIDLQLKPQKVQPLVR